MPKSVNAMAPIWGASLLAGLFAIVFTAGGGYHVAALRKVDRG